MSTVQRRETSVPVGYGGGKAGPTRPSSSDRGEMEVGDQANISKIATGSPTNRQPQPGLSKSGYPSEPRGGNYPIFQLEEQRLRKTSTATENISAITHEVKKIRTCTTVTSPPKPWSQLWDQPNATSTPEGTSSNISYLDLTWNEEEGRSVKRKRIDKIENASVETRGQPKTYKLQEKIVELIKKLDKETTNMNKMLADKSNVKREIKDISQRIRSVMSQLMTKEIQNILEMKPTEETNKIIYECQNTSKIPKPETREIGCQTEHKNKMRNVVSIAQVREAKTYEKYKQIAQLQWAEGIFKSAHMAEGSPLQANRDADVVVWAQDDEEEEIQKQIFARYPELKDAEGNFSQISIITKLIDRQGLLKVNERLMTKIETDGSEKECFERLVNLKENMLEKSRRKVALYPPNKDSNGSRLRRMLECIFKDTDIKCIIYNRKQESDDERIQMRNYKTKKKKKEFEQTDAIVISQQGKTYSELLKTVKTTFADKPESANKIKTVRQTKDGKMLIVIDKEKVSVVEEIKNILEPEVGNADIQMRTGGKDRLKTLYIKNMDQITTKEEVKGALEKEIGEWKEIYKIGNLRPFQGKNQAITITLTEKEANKLVEKETIKIGLNRCEIYERINVTICYRCWKYGHRTADCKEEEKNYSKHCRNCGTPNHHSKECKEEKKCLTCWKIGHSAGTGSCPKFRFALRAAQQAAKEMRDDKEKERIPASQNPKGYEEQTGKHSPKNDQKQPQTTPNTNKR